jgi:ribosomal protein S18 acetylase RimI-like enzyme
VNETRTYLEMTSRADLRPAREPGEPVSVSLQQPPDPQLNRQLYVSVGQQWRWIDRLPWSDAVWAVYVQNPELETWVMRVGAEPAGYVELALPADRNAQIMYFGLLPGFIGRGLGGYLLTRAVQRAWDAGAQRVWLHTSSLDHPHALANYLARGFRVCDTEER